MKSIWCNCTLLHSPFLMHNLVTLVGAGLDFHVNRLESARCNNVWQIIVPLTWMSLCSCQGTLTQIAMAWLRNKTIWPVVPVLTVGSKKLLGHRIRNTPLKIYVQGRHSSYRSACRTWWLCCYGYLAWTSAWWKRNRLEYSGDDNLRLQNRTCRWRYIFLLFSCLLLPVFLLHVLFEHDQWPSCYLWIWQCPVGLTVHGAIKIT